MARRNGTKEDLIKCEYCGEMYAASYKHCPFCNEDGTGRWDDPATLDDEEYYDEDLPVRGGRRLAHNSRSGGNGPSVRSIISWVLSLALIIAAAGIVISLLKPLLGKGEPKPEQPEQSVPPVEDSAAPSPALSAEPSADPVVDPTADPAPTPSVGIMTPSVPLTAPTDFKLSREDISFFNVGEYYQFVVTLTPADAHGDVQWKSSDPNVASVSWDGKVTAISKGTVTITASIEGVGERKCIVRCSLPDSTPAATTPPSEITTSQPSASSSITLSREDFTLSKPGESWRLVVKGTSSAVTWASTDPNVATVGADGTVTAVSKGTCRVTATVDGVTLKCIVRCTF